MAPVIDSEVLPGNPAAGPVYTPGVLETKAIYFGHKAGNAQLYSGLITIHDSTSMDDPTDPAHAKIKMKIENSVAKVNSAVGGWNYKVRAHIINPTVERLLGDCQSSVKSMACRLGKVRLDRGALEKKKRRRTRLDKKQATSITVCL